MSSTSPVERNGSPANAVGAFFAFLLFIGGLVLFTVAFSVDRDRGAVGLRRRDLAIASRSDPDDDPSGARGPRGLTPGAARPADLRRSSQIAHLICPRPPADRTRAPRVGLSERGRLPARHSRRPALRHPAWRVVALVALAVPLFAASAAGFTYARLNGNIDTADDVDQYLGTQRPTPSASPDPLVDGFAGRPLNILVMGIDARDGDNANFAGQFPGQRSDSTFLVHLSADRSRVDIVSVPRDSLVKIPACKLKDGSETAPRPFEMFNAAFDIGSGPDLDLTTAAACTRKTFEQDTGVRTDEHIVIKMDGVRDVINTLGGVPFCLPEAMDSPKARLKASAGKHVFTGQQAIGFLRSRTGTGNGLGSAATWDASTVSTSSWSP